MHINEIVIWPSPLMGHCSVWPDTKNNVAEGFVNLSILMNRYQTRYPDRFGVTLEVIYAATRRLGQMSCTVTYPRIKIILTNWNIERKQSSLFFQSYDFHIKIYLEIPNRFNHYTK